MSAPQIVIDTNVIIAALRSQRGASYRLLMLADSGKFRINLSVPLVAEYEEVARRILVETTLAVSDLNDILDYLCTTGNRREIFFLWRPFLLDPDDDMVLELAVASHSQFIVTFNVGDFKGCENFGIRAITPFVFLREIGELP